jgi:hypothetical protein
MEIVKSIILTKRPVKQPEVRIVSGGDCGACVLAGLLGCSLKEAYQLHQISENMPKEHPFSIWSMKKTLEMLVPPFHKGEKNSLVHAVTEIPIWPFDYMLPHNSAFGLLGMHMFRSWNDNLIAMLHGGYYGITQVHNHGYRDKFGDGEGNYPDTNHWVMICGWRLILEGNRYDDQILIGNSSSSTDLETWVDVQDFLKYWGGFSCMYAKPIDL